MKSKTYPSIGNFGSEAGKGVGLGSSVGPTEVGVANGGNGVIVGNAVGDVIGVSEGTGCVFIRKVVVVMPAGFGARVAQETRRMIKISHKYRYGARL